MADGYEGVEQLKSAVSRLAQSVRAAQSGWADSKYGQFVEGFVDPLTQQADATIEQMSEMVDALEDVQRRLP